MRTRDARGGAHLLLRAEAANGRLLAFYNMEGRWVRENTDWTHYSVVIDIPESASVIVIGASLVNAGSLWIDDAQIVEVPIDRQLTQPPFAAVVYNEPVDARMLPPRLLNAGFEEVGFAPEPRPD
jgi:hypothetical protein